MRASLRRSWKRLRRTLRPVAVRIGIRDPLPGPDPAPGSPIPESLVGQLRLSFGEAGGTGSESPPPPPSPDPSPDPFPDASPDPSPDPSPHRHVWVRGPGYTEMEDNDIRGFLDGRVVHGWNQPSQIHVRVGRFYLGPNLGEWEIFRILQRWSGIRLPWGARVTDAEMILTVEKGVDPSRGVDREMEVLLYNVHKDWCPGEGGLKKNNMSRAAPGEVWWNEVGQGGERWGLPGAGFASDTHPDADTPAVPLAVGRYRPGEDTVSFSSSRLAAYVQERALAGEPLLFLVKLSDHLEDATGSLLCFYSANHGDDRNTVRRPRLVVDWTPGRACRRARHDILLEHGRSLILPRIEAEGLQTVAGSYHPGESPERPTLYMRTGRDGEVSEWAPLGFPRALQADWLEVRVDACQNPVPIGEPFIARFRDTLVKTGSLEAQEVPWVFRAPSGREHRILAEFQGDFTWCATFVPDEVGRWEYRWSQRFLKEPYRSAEGSFDVIAGGRGNALRALERLEGTILDSGLPSETQRVLAFAPSLNRLQRGLMRTQTPEEFDLEGADPGGVGAWLDRIRQVISRHAASGGSRLEPRD